MTRGHLGTTASTTSANGPRSSSFVTHYRQLRELTRDELSYVLEMAGHPLSANEIARMERRERPITVDDLIALAHALGGMIRT